MSKTGSAFTCAQPPLSGGCQFLSLALSEEAGGLRVWLNKPEGGAPQGGWPVLIVLDGESYFSSAAEIMQRLSRRTAKTRIVPMMVVGVAHDENQDRVASYAFTAGRNVAEPKAGMMLERLQNEILPLLVREGADRENITLAGHSMSALFVLEALARNSGFARYAAISPSIWFNPDITDKLDAKQISADRLMLAVGELEEPTGAPTAQLARGMVSKLTALGRKLGLPVEVCENEDHGSVIFTVMPGILRFASRYDQTKA